MAQTIGALTCSHAPSIADAYDGGRRDDPKWAPLFEGYDAVYEWLCEQDPDLLVIITNDHATHFSQDTGWPTFAVGAAHEYRIGDEGDGGRDLPPVPGDREFSEKLAKGLVKRDFDITLAYDYTIDHGVHSPLPILNSQWRWPISIVHINCAFSPRPSVQRCWDFGVAVGEAVREIDTDQRVVFIGLGGLSHQLCGPQFGTVNSPWDTEILRLMTEDPQALVNLTMEDFATRGGEESAELVHWLAARAALGEHARTDVTFLYPTDVMGYGGMTFASVPAPAATAS